jgi:hypothetical protein
MKIGLCSIIRRLCAYGGPVQASNTVTIKLTHYPSWQWVSLRNDPEKRVLAVEIGHSQTQNGPLFTRSLVLAEIGHSQIQIRPL